MVTILRVIDKDGNKSGFLFSNPRNVIPFRNDFIFHNRIQYKVLYTERSINNDLYIICNPTQTRNNIMKINNIEVDDSIIGMNPRFDKALLPSYYEYQEEPYYPGDGNLSVSKLQELCNKFKEYCHQQALIKQQLIEHINSPKITTEVSADWKDIDGLSNEFSKAVSLIGGYCYEDPTLEGSDMYGFIVSNKPLTEEEINNYYEDL